MFTASRVLLPKVTPKNYAALRQLRDAVVEGAVAAGLEPGLIHLVDVRASQVNGCAFCVDKHTKEARAKGEGEQRLYALTAWRDTPFFTERERAALALTEAVTLVHDGHVPDEVYDAAAEQFSEEELGHLLWLIILINSFNRIAISTRLRIEKS